MFLFNEIPAGMAFVNNTSLSLLQNTFNIGPWSYIDRNPFELCLELDEREKRIKEIRLDR